MMTHRQQAHDHQLFYFPLQSFYFFAVPTVPTYMPVCVRFFFLGFNLLRLPKACRPFDWFSSECGVYAASFVPETTLFIASNFQREKMCSFLNSLLYTPIPLFIVVLTTTSLLQCNTHEEVLHFLPLVLELTAAGRGQHPKHRKALDIVLKKSICLWCCSSVATLLMLT